MRWQAKNISIEPTNIDIPRKTSADLPPTSISQNNKAFVEKLLKVLLSLFFKLFLSYLKI